MSAAAESWDTLKADTIGALVSCTTGLRSLVLGKLPPSLANPNASQVITLQPAGLQPADVYEVRLSLDLVDYLLVGQVTCSCATKLTNPG